MFRSVDDMLDHHHLVHPRRSPPRVPRRGAGAALAQYEVEARDESLYPRGELLGEAADLVTTVKYPIDDTFPAMPDGAEVAETLMAQVETRQLRSSSTIIDASTLASRELTIFTYGDVDDGQAEKAREMGATVSFDAKCLG